MAASSTLLLLLLSCMWLWLFSGLAEAEYLKYKDPKLPVQDRIDDLLSRMTLEEKIGQMAQIENHLASPQVLKDYSIGSVFSKGGSSPADRASPEIWIHMVNELQKGALSSRLGIPMLYAIDAIHGHNTVYNATIFPHNIGLGATRDPELVKRIGAATALELRATGIPYTFAPCVAVCRDPRWGRCYESFSEDPNLVVAMTEVVSGFQGEIPPDSPKGVPYIAGDKNVAACAKHYVGDGGTARGLDGNNTVISMNELLRIHMPPYQSSITKGVATIMLSHSSLNGVRMHVDRELVTGYLKYTLNFEGVVVSDYEGIDNLTSPPRVNYSSSIEAAINAGIDMAMLTWSYEEFRDGLMFLVENGVVPMSRINDAVRRILRVKFVMRLFEKPMADYKMINEIGSQNHRDLAREAVRRSLVLLKNGKSIDHPLLPLPKRAPRVLVAGSHANNLGYQCGGWTITWKGFSGNDMTTGTTILDAIQDTVHPKTKVVYKENPDADFVESNNFSYAIVVVGEYPYAEEYGDSIGLGIAEPGPRTIRNVCGYVKCVVVTISGRPVAIEPYIDQIDALVAAWLPGSEGKGVTDVLFGHYGFTGKLPRTWFKSVDQLPMNVGDPSYDPLFPFGFGLTTNPTKPFYSSK